MLLLFNHRKFRKFEKCKLLLIAYIKLKGNHFTPYYLSLNE